MKKARSTTDQPAAQVEFRETTTEDIKALSRLLESGEATELLAVCDSPLDDTLNKAHDAAVFSFVATLKDKPIFLYGIREARPDHPDMGYVWMVCTPKARSHAKELVEVCQAVLEVALDGEPGSFTAVTCLADSGNITAPTWLKALGFEHIRDWRKEGREAGLSRFQQYARCD